MIGVFVRDGRSDSWRHFLTDEDIRYSECGKFVGNGRIVAGDIVDWSLPLCEKCLRKRAERLVPQ